MRQAGQAEAVAVQLQPLEARFGEGPLVWEAASTTQNWTDTAPDRTYTVSIRTVQERAITGLQRYSDGVCAVRSPPLHLPLTPAPAL